MRLARFDRWDTPLTDITTVTSATWTSSVDGTRSLELTCPGELDAVKGERIVFLDPRGRLEETILVSPEHTRGETRATTSLMCKGALTELDDTFIEDKRNRDATAAQCLAKALETTRWQVGIVEGDTRADLAFYHISVLQAVERIADTFGLEVVATYVADGDGTRITDRIVNLLTAQGERHVRHRFEYGRDLKGVTRTIDASSVKTRLYGYGKGLPATDETGEETGGYGRKISFADINNGQPYVENRDATARWGIPGPSGMPGDNLVTDSGFEKTHAPNWLLSPSTAFLDALVSSDNGITPYAGKRMLRMGPDRTTCALSAYSDPIAVAGGHQYELECWTRADPTVTCPVTITQNITLLPTSDISIEPPHNTGDWTRTVRRFTVHDRTSTVQIRFGTPTGVMYVDDVTLREIQAAGIMPAEGVYENSNCEDPAQLLAETRARLNQVSEPIVSYEADVLAFTRAGMNTRDVGLGDQVQLVDPTFTPTLRLEGRVLQLEEDLLDSSRTVITIGNIIPRYTTGTRRIEQRLDQVIADAGTWNASSTQVARNAGRWEQTTQTVADNASLWNDTAHTVQTHSDEWTRAATLTTSGATNWDTAAQTVNAGASRWDTAASIVTSRHTEWDQTVNTLNAGKEAWDRASQATDTGVQRWDQAAATATTLAQALNHNAAGTRLTGGNVTLTLNDQGLTLTDSSGTWTFHDGTFTRTT